MQIGDFIQCFPSKYDLRIATIYGETKHTWKAKMVWPLHPNYHLRRVSVSKYTLLDPSVSRIQKWRVSTDPEASIRKNLAEAVKAKSHFDEQKAKREAKKNEIRKANPNLQHAGVLKSDDDLRVATFLDKQGKTGMVFFTWEPCDMRDEDGNPYLGARIVKATLYCFDSTSGYYGFRLAPGFLYTGANIQEALIDIILDHAWE
jgi:hypothetical protein